MSFSFFTYHANPAVPTSSNVHTVNLCQDFLPPFLGIGNSGFDFECWKQFGWYRGLRSDPYGKNIRNDDDDCRCRLTYLNILAKSSILNKCMKLLTHLLFI